MKVLIVEDNQQLAENIKDYLSREGYICEFAANYEDGLEKVNIYPYDIVVLDIMLPDGSGLDLLTFIKKEKSDLGVLIVSAKNALGDKIKGLDLGADDYLTKPFHLPELNARLKALYRRKNFNGSKELIFNELEINTDTFDVVVNNNLLVLTKKEYELLLYFLANKNRVLTKQTIAEHLWGDHTDFMDSFDFVYQHIKNLRKKVAKAGGRPYISNIYGIGYKFDTSK